MDRSVSNPVEARAQVLSRIGLADIEDLQARVIGCCGEDSLAALVFQAAGLKHETLEGGRLAKTVVGKDGDAVADWVVG